MPLASAIASSSDSYELTTQTGPKTSSRQTFRSGAAFAITVGLIRSPSRSPPESTSAPAVARLVDPAQDPLPRALVDHRADVGLGVGRIADRRAASTLGTKPATKSS